MDVFIDMLPADYHDHPDGFSYETLLEHGKHAVAIKSGSIGARTMRGMRSAVAAMAAEGNNLIVDDVLLGSEKAEYAALLSPFDVYFVGVFAPLDVFEARERERRDRLIGLALWQFSRVHEGMTYDLEVNTDSASPMECATLIRDQFQL
jgi:chloramphenicol 3-O phosphotransferase